MNCQRIGEDGFDQFVALCYPKEELQFSSSVESDAFWQEMDEAYLQLLKTFQKHGAHGDDYRRHDFRLAPGPLDVRRNIRQFCLGIITKRFWESPFLQESIDFLRCRRPDFRILVGCDIWPRSIFQRFIVPQHFELLLTRDEARFYSESSRTAKTLEQALRAL